MQQIKNLKFRNLKKDCCGYVAKNINTGELRTQTFIARDGNSKITGHNQVWTKLAPQLGYTGDYFSLTKEERSTIIKKLVNKGWRIAPVILQELTSI